uniref:Putative tick transposon n=1 Tax=Rhipicephalus pulchellus TaxID=72859 RepID=L7LY07_RHIPC
MRTVSDQPVPRPPLKFVVCALFVSSSLISVLAQRVGFVVLPEGMFQSKALEAVHKNFKVVHFCPKKRKRSAQKLLKELNLDPLRKEVAKAKNVSLQSFFTCKTHKCGYPLRLIVSEKGSWQRSVAGYLQGILGSLRSGDPFLVQSSVEIVSALKEGMPSASTAFSIDVEELFYSIPHDGLFDAVRHAIDEFGEVKFQNKFCIFTNSFLELLKFYLESTVISYQDGFYVQKAGICIGSAVAPVLSDIFLAAFDQRLKDEMSSLGVVRTFRYVDDYLIVLGDIPGELRNGTVKGVLETFARLSGGLKFTHEMPVENEIQFLDLRLKFSEEHVCYRYNPRSKKGLLPYESAHSKVIKRGIVLSTCAAALNKSCPHQMPESFKAQVSRLRAAGYPLQIISGACEGLLQKYKATKPKDKEKKPVHVMPYLHRISHNVKKVANRYGVEVAFSAPSKLGQICSLMTKQKKWECSTKHAIVFTACVAWVVYCIPLSCGRVYIGQTGRCLNERMREHNLAVKEKYGGHLDIHCRSCGCIARFEHVTVIGRARERTEREIIEAYFIRQYKDKCVSMASITLSDKEAMFLNGHV